MSASSTVAPHQMRKPGGASRWLAMSSATPSPSRKRAMSRPRAGARPPSLTAEAHRSVGARLGNAARTWAQARSIGPIMEERGIGIGAGDKRVEPAQRVAPIRAARIQSSTHSMEGVLMVSPSNRARSSLPPLVSRKILGSGQGGRWLSSRSMARGDSTSMPWAASPPSTFCQEKVTTSSLAKSSRWAKAAEVASQMVRPSPVGGDPGSHRARARPRWCRSR